MPQNHVILLHGMFGNPEQWSECAKHLSPRWQAHTPSLPILDVPPNDHAIQELGNRMIREMDNQGIDRAVIGGNSLGGHIAIRMALGHPDRVAGLVLTGSSGLFERGFERKVPRRPSEAYMREKILEIFHDPVHMTDELVADLKTFLADLRNVIRMVRLAKCAKHDNLRTLLPTITCPVLLLWGENDNITPPSVACEFHQLLPNSELLMIDRCGHVPMLERPEICNDRIATFLSRVFPESGTPPTPHLP
jgi:pimeloyl-ACP methyl ester carboxylesterase